MTEVLTYEALKADRDALADKCDRLEYNLGNAIVGEQEALQRVNALAVDNAALKAINDDRRMFIMNGVQLGYIKVPTVEVDPALETIRIAVSPQVPTPATSEALADIQAQGVEMFAELFKETVNMERKHNQEFYKGALWFAKQLLREAK